MIELLILMVAAIGISYMMDDVSIFYILWHRYKLVTYHKPRDIKENGKGVDPNNEVKGIVDEREGIGSTKVKEKIAL